jgi:F-type H+-transporting ATPase subunit b
MEIVTPGIGLIFWTALLFLIVLFILGRVAFKPISEALKEREESIAKALNASVQAQEDVGKLKSEIDEMKKKAREEREEILKEAKAKATQLVSEAQEKAKEEGNRIISAAQEAIQSEKNAAMTEVKQQVAALALDIAEKVLRKELSNATAQKALINDLLKEAKLN